MTRLAVALATAVVLAGAASSSSGSVTEPARLSYSVSVGLRAESYDRFTGAGLCLAGPNGSEGTRLTAPKFDESPAWSPDGRRLAFSRNAKIFVQNGLERTRLIADPGDYNDDPSWSPDGRRVVFESGRTGSGSSIYSARSDGSDVHRLTESGFQVWDTSPAWSPAGGAIAFGEGDQEGRVDLFLINPDGGDRRLLAKNGGGASWSPDGSLLVFARYSAPYVGADLMIIGADGRGVRFLTSTPDIEETDPAWSPDGDWIAFETRPSNQGGGDIALIRPDGSGLHILKLSALSESDPAWRPHAGKRPGPQRPCAIRATRGGALRGTSRGDLILEGDGSDLVFAGGGDDLVDGGPGADRIVGGRGRDILNGGFGSDRLVGGPGNDLLYADDDERDAAIGNGGRDTAYVDSLDRIVSVERVYRESP